jgi:tyrosine-protein phosphatase SIW14
MRVWGRWVLAILVAAMIVGVPTAYYRAVYAHAHRLRVVEPGVAYRCGQLTAAGFRDAIKRYWIKLVINLREDEIDPLIPETWQAKPTVRESDLCRQLGVRYEVVNGGDLTPAPGGPADRPAAIDHFLKLVDEARANHEPVLYHCKAGRDRTGQFTALYRIEYNGRSKADALREMKANGFEPFAATDGNVYVRVFIRDYEPRAGRGKPQAAKAGGANRGGD